MTDENGRGPLGPDALVELFRPIGTAAASGAELLDELVAFLRRFVVMSDAQADAIALWIVHTHTFQAAITTPYLSVRSAEKQSGKTRLLEVLDLLAHRPLRTANLSEAALFRKLAETPVPTLLMDEVDALFGPKAHDNHEDLRALLNAGYRAGTPVHRCVGEGRKISVEEFNVFSPKVLAGIGGLPDTIADRCLPVRLRRKARGERIERFRLNRTTGEAKPLYARVAGWAGAQVEKLERAEPELPDELTDRQQDVCEPLLAIADLAAADWPLRARRALLELCADRDDDESTGVKLLTAIRAVFERLQVDRLSTAALLGRLGEDDEAGWAEWLTARKLARILKPYEVRSRTVRFADGSTPKGFHLEQFEDPFQRYLPSAGDLSATTPQPASLSEKEAASIRHTEGLVAERKQGANPHEYSDVADVADSGDEAAFDEAEVERIERLYDAVSGEPS